LSPNDSTNTRVEANPVRASVQKSPSCALLSQRSDGEKDAQHEFGHGYTDWSKPAGGKWPSTNAPTNTQRVRTAFVYSCNSWTAHPHRSGHASRIMNRGERPWTTTHETTRKARKAFVAFAAFPIFAIQMPSSSFVCRPSSAGLARPPLRSCQFPADVGRTPLALQRARVKTLPRRFWPGSPKFLRVFHRVCSWLSLGVQPCLPKLGIESRRNLWYNVGINQSKALSLPSSHLQ